MSAFDTTSNTSDYLNNFGKGGDFMEQDDPARQAAIEDAIRRMDWEGPGPRGEANTTIQPGQGRETIDKRHPSTHPMRRGGWIRPTVLELAQEMDQEGRPTVDWVVFKSAQEMDGRGS